VPLDAKGVTILRPLYVFGYDDAPHGHMEIELKDVRVPASNLLLGEGRGFEIAQGRLGPGPYPPLHAHDRCGGSGARKNLQAASPRASRSARPLPSTASGSSASPEARIDIEMTRLLVPQGRAHDGHAGNKVAKNEIAMIKVQAPRYGAEDHRRCHPGAWRRWRLPGFRLAKVLCRPFARCVWPTVPDEVHARSIAMQELGKYGWTGKRAKDDGVSLPGMR
jgi:acyl-CoA dehydrogenase